MGVGAEEGQVVKSWCSRKLLNSESVVEICKAQNIKQSTQAYKTNKPHNQIQAVVLRPCVQC